MIEPTGMLLDLCRKYNTRMTFFVDAGYLLRLEEYAPEYPELRRDLEEIRSQIREMTDCGCSVELHIHPHWERSSYVNGKWNIVTDGAYRLADFTEDERRSIFIRYHDYLQRLTGQKIHSFRAGGWCIQPFDQLADLFREQGIRIDSSVFPGGSFFSPHYDFDFTKVPRFSDRYTFEEDVCQPVAGGSFCEYPIASWRYSPLFYWRLYILGRLLPQRHKMLGDGLFLAQPGRKRSVLTGFTWNHVSSDGYYAGKLRRQARYYQRLGVDYFVVIGHPKSLTIYAKEQLEAFLKSTKNKYSFPAFSELTCN